jgi:hypothetical protein
MKEGFDKEIDSLLRRRARGGAALRDDIDGARAPGVAAHLDADELGAFAEGALPAAARLSAVSHLADCDECRSVVVGLARVSGVEAESKKRAAVGAVPTMAAKPVAWRAWVSSLFAPRVLRYAAPALALCVVAVVSFIALRSRQGSERGAVQLARNEERRQSEALQDRAGGATGTTEMANANTGATVPQAFDNAARNSNAANAHAQPSSGGGHGAAEASSAATDAKDDEAPASPPPPPPAERTEGPREAAKAAPKPVSTEEGESARTETKERVASKAEPAETTEVASSDQPSQQKRAAQSRGFEAQMPDGSRNQKRSSDNTQSNAAVGGGSNVASAAPRAADRDSMAKSAPGTRRNRSDALADKREDAKEDGRVEETRSAAGHRFRREGGAWVDVNYKDSMSSTGVRRGSEGFRALVADIPEIGRIAEQIGGEVVVVVRGRAYRVR